MTNETAQTASGNTSDKNALLEKYTRPKYPALAKPAVSAEPEESGEIEDGRYRALVEYRDKRGSAPRFRIIDRQGRIYGCGYAYLLGWFYTPPETLSIQTTTHVFTLGGQNMGRIEQALLREKVKELREFKPGDDVAPEAGEPLITFLSVSSRFEEKAS
ncbi:hypothetical protein GCM10028808_62410 [Spirosoma migulaei]